MFSVRPKGYVKVNRDSKMVYATNKYNRKKKIGPNMDIMRKWSELTPMNYDFVESIYKYKKLRTIKYDSTLANSQWVEDVYMKIGDSMFFYTG